MSTRSVVCGRCGNVVKVSAGDPSAVLLQHGETCSRRLDHTSITDDVDRTLRTRSGKDRRKVRTTT